MEQISGSCRRTEIFEHSVASLDGILPELVMDLVRGELTWETMEQKYNVSHAMIGKYRKAAMKELDFCTSFVDKQTEAFILG